MCKDAGLDCRPVAAAGLAANQPPHRSAHSSTWRSRLSGRRFQCGVRPGVGHQPPGRVQQPAPAAAAHHMPARLWRHLHLQWFGQLPRCDWQLWQPAGAGFAVHLSGHSAQQPAAYALPLALPLALALACPIGETVRVQARLGWELHGRVLSIYILSICRWCLLEAGVLLHQHAASAPIPPCTRLPISAPQPSPAPAYQAMWVSNLLLGGTVGDYQNESELQPCIGRRATGLPPLSTYTAMPPPRWLAMLAFPCSC